MLADGQPIGRTPVQISQVQNFPPRWHGTSYTVKGRLEFRKPGCEPYSLEMNEGMLLKDIQVRLQCDPGAVEADESREAEEEKGPAPDAGTTNARAVEARLERLKELRERGVITSEEYRQQRKRILDSL